MTGNSPSEERDFLDSREFYELMQAYRWSGLPHSPEPKVVETFEAVKEYIRRSIWQRGPIP